MRFLQKYPFIFQSFLITAFLSQLAVAYELTITNNPVFPTDSDTFFFSNRLIYENSSTFYLVQLGNGFSRNLLQVDQDNNNNISAIGELPIDNLQRSTFFLAFSMKNYLGFIYDQQTEDGNIGALLIVQKNNFTITSLSSLFSSYVAATYLSTREVILAVSTHNAVSIINNPENQNISTINGPLLVNTWGSWTDTVLMKSFNENYLLIFSLTNQVFQLLTVGSQLTTGSDLSIIIQNLTGVNSVCFVLEEKVAVHQNSTVSFYSLPSFQFDRQQSIDLVSSSECYLDTITGELIFVYEQNNETIFWSYNMSNGQQMNTTIVSNTTNVFLSDSKIYVVNLEQNTSLVGYSFFDYQSCHRAYYYDDQTFICYECPSGCNSCNSSQFCYSDCLAGNYFIDDYCCGNSQYYLIVSAQKNCFNCPTGCYNCTSSQVCLTCRTKNYFIDDYCCGNSQYYLIANSSKHCFNCPNGCYNCSSSQLCITCLGNYNFIDDYCCGVSQYYVNGGGSKSCGNCPSGCYNCSGLQYCYTCKANNLLVNNYCCGVGKYVGLINGSKSCQACPSGCYNCSNLTFCYTCTAGKVLIDNFCCTANQFVQTISGVSSCASCRDGCATCRSASFCLTCDPIWMMGTDNLCYNSTDGMPTGEEGNGPTIAAKAMTQNGFVSFFNSIPSLRGILRPIFGGFIWFDELYLFQFHQRDYGMNMQLLFRQVQIMQEEKWAGANWLITDHLLAIFSSSVNKITQSLNYKKDYTSTFWINRKNNGEGFLVNTLSYFLSVTFLTFLIYLIVRFVFYLLFKHRWSMFFRSYSFWPYLVILLMEGNLPQLIFFACGEFKLSFSQVFSQKVSTVFTWWFYFFMVIFSTAMFPLLFSGYRQRTRYFSDNLHRPFKNIVVVYLTIELGFRHLFQGMIHYFLKDGPYYQLQLSLLIVAEVMICSSYLFFISRGCFNYRFKVWLSVVQSLGKLIFLFFLFLRMQYLDVSQLNYKTDKILGYVAAFYLAMVYINLAISCLILLKEAYSNWVKRLRKDEQQRMKSILDAKQKETIKTQKEKVRQAQEVLRTYSNLKTCKTVKQDRSIFFRNQSNKPLVTQTNIVKVVRIKRGQQCQ